MTDNEMAPMEALQKADGQETIAAKRGAPAPFIVVGIASAKAP